MKTLLPCELRDPDGSYVLVQPFDEIRCRVIASNVARKDRVLYKGDGLNWQDAAEDLGGFTRLGPCEMLQPAGEECPAECEDDAEFLHEDRPPAGDFLAQVEDPRTSKRHEQEIDADLRAAILRLAIHYQQVHERREGGTRWMNLCRCPKYSPEGDVRKARLHAMVSYALLADQLPSRSRIREAIRAASRDRTDVA